MASLRDTVKDYQEELRDGIAWVAFWKTGRSWNAEYFHLEMGDYLYPEDRSRMEEIKQADPAAVVVNGYYSGYLGEDMSLDELTAGVRRHYENGYSNIGEFIEAHDDRLPPELIEEARAAAHAAGLPFSEKAYRDGEEPDPYIFDGSMSMEDYELMHRMIENERSERMAETILSGYLSNLGKYTEGRPAGEWVSFPTTAEHLKEVFDRIGIDGKNYGELHITEYQSSIAGLAGKLTEFENLDELNYLGELLKMQFDDDREKFVAAMAYGDHTRDLQDIINLAQNLDCYWLYPSVQSEEDYGHYLIEELDELELPEEAKKYFMYEEYGRDAAINDGGRFTEQGYIYNNRNTFTEWYDGRDVPEEYRVTPQPPVQEKEQADLDASAAIPPAATEQPPVLPIILSSEKPADKMKEITDRLEQGILGLYESDRYADYLRTMSKFHDYSLNNTILIAMQGGNLVKGYKQWEKEFDRHVKPGEKAIKILAPSPFTIKKQVEKIDPDTQKPVFDKDGKPVTEEKEIKIPAFRVVSVFDISQTEGKELPALTYELTGNVEQYKDFFAALEKTSPFAMGFEALSGGVKGRCNYEEKRIIINEGMDELQNIKTAIHEIAHATLHDTALAMPERPDRRTREVQAESVAYAVCQHYGLDTSDYSFGYIAGWSSGKELAELKGSLETIRSTAASLIDTIDGHFAEIQKAQDKEQTTEQAQPAQEATKQPEAEVAAPELPEETAPVQEKEAQTEPEADTGASSETPQTTQPEQAAPAAPYYPINEAAAKRAKDMNSFSDYKQGSATAEYRHYVDEAVQLAERQKQRVDPMYHEKIDSLLDTYARKLAANMNKGYEIDARVPSILIAGGSNFPTRKKEKQNAARDSNYREWQDIQGLLDKIRSTGMGGISADDPQAVQKLEKKLESLEKSQETMKDVNAYYRKYKTLDGCPHLPPEQLEKLKADMASSWHLGDKPFATWALSNNSAEIRRVKDRIKSLSQQKEIGFVGWEFDGGKVEANTEANRLQIFFEDKPDEATREALKSNGFRWSPKAGAWQRQLTSNAYYAADYVKAIAPLTGEKPTELQRAHIRQQKVAAQEQPAQEQPENYLKAAEQTTEQNYNMIDGQINNTPTAAELEEKAKAGKQISLAEYAEALKVEKKQAAPEKKPSIRAQLKAAKEQTPKKQARQKTQDLERS
ncbi:Antirestriction protein [Clostridioides difficile]|uniref:antirestriction protein ArdA n=1 Tax=Clostridioides difficile TaxID=1496 RepID=UPI0009800FA8|nr:antirestriction protein ArdA [Clostridioides difficile]SJS96181.1 Antirestriction protein [Clostridioides difficile]HBG4987935.1 antirestriction protein ArdA [Clostridioides difficile]HBZ0210376.1 antirestriction protein ArdA [Clostridioides difficile]